MPHVVKLIGCSMLVLFALASRAQAQDNQSLISESGVTGHNVKDDVFPRDIAPSLRPPRDKKPPPTNLPDDFGSFDDVDQTINWGAVEVKSTLPPIADGPLIDLLKKRQETPRGGGPIVANVPEPGALCLLGLLALATLRRR